MSHGISTHSKRSVLMNTSNPFTSLRTILTDLYPTENDARRVVADAGLNARNIEFSSQATNNWHAILVEAQKSSRIDVLIADVALNDYANHQELSKAYDEYQVWFEQVGPDFESAIDEKAPAPGDSPYKGLQFFDQNDADLFFGREVLTAKLVGHLREHRFLAVVGASGSGKSSAVRAGVIPALKRDASLVDGTRPPNESLHWPVYVITPPAHPLKELASTLTQDALSVRATSVLMDDLANDARSLDLAVHRVLSQTSANRLLLVVDQFEELFTLCRDANERQAFVDNLLTAAVLEENGPTIVTLTLRADFYAHCAEFDELREALAKRQEYIGPMTTDELRQVIEEPAQRNGWEFEAGLVDLLLQDVGDEPGALPLLSHALLETWKRRQGHTLTFEGYTESGRVQGAIARTAETTFNQLETEQQAIARNIFLRLTELGEGTQDTRRRTALTELIPESEKASDIEKVLTILADARLITTEQENAEVAHEALIREWSMLRRWLDENREGLQIHRRLTEAAQEWETLAHDPGLLYRSVLLEQALEWVKEHEEELNEAERSFLKASKEAIETEQREKEAVQQYRLEQAEALALEQQGRADEQEQHAKQMGRRAFYLGVASVGMLIALITTGLFFQQATEQRQAAQTSEADEAIARQAEAYAKETAKAQQIIAEDAQQEAFTRQLAAQTISSIELKQDAELSLLLVVQSAKAMNNTNTYIQQVDNALRRALAVAPKHILRHEASVWNVVFSPNGRRLVTRSQDDTVRLFDSESGQELVTLRHEAKVGSVVFSPDGSRLATASWDGDKGTSTVRLWRMNMSDLVELACQTLSRNFKPEEWKLYVGDTRPYQTTCPDSSKTESSTLKSTTLPVVTSTPVSIPFLTSALTNTPAPTSTSLGNSPLSSP
ncbi:hypothetical protein KFU94_01415 [Chloroflexi bacterium TSY]|nr:hypothetical protein [Chloroflexi bacterium TSY]